jgi:hypothetical protein
MIRVLYDGWPLAYQPNSPEALHLIALLEQRHSEVIPLVAAPADISKWLPSGIEVQLFIGQDTPRGRLQWEQSILSRLAADMQADLLHLTRSHPPLFSKLRSLVSPAEYPIHERQPGFLSHLREAVSSGGMARLGGLIWPADLASLAPADGTTSIYFVPAEPWLEGMQGVSQSLLQAEDLNLPETYILAPCPQTLSVQRLLLDAWSWASGSIGEYYPLYILGLDSKSQGRVEVLVHNDALGQSVKLLPPLHPGSIPALVQGSAALFHPGPLSPWGSIARLALAYGKPLVTSESPMADALVGPAAFMAPATNPRLLGAGLITVIIEADVAQAISQAGHERAASWNSPEFSEKIFAAYAAVLAQT